MQNYKKKTIIYKQNYKNTKNMLNRFSQEIKKNSMKNQLEKENTISEIMSKTIQMMIATRT